MTTVSPMSVDRVLPDPERSAAYIADLCQYADQPTRDKFTALEVVELLTACGYAVDAETLKEFGAKGYLTIPPRMWTPTQIHRLVGALEARRRWLPGAKLHLPKRSAAALEREREPEAFAEASRQYTAEDLLLMLVSVDCRHTREMIYESLLVRLADAGIKL